MGEFNQIKYMNDFNKRTYKSYSVRVRRDNVKVIDKLDSEPSVNRYIIELIEKDIEATSENGELYIQND